MSAFRSIVGLILGFLGFINVTPIELLLEVKWVDPQQNELELWVLPVASNETSPSLVAIARWFGEVYPSRTREDCYLKNAAAFDRLISMGTAVLYNPSPMAPMSPSLLTVIQQRLSWPTFPLGEANRM